MHGDVNAAYRIRDHEWSQLAKGDPQWPQAFYPTNEMFDLKDGDALVGRCTYHNDEARTIYAGPTHKDEMCNIYLMYYTDDISGVQDTCSGNSFPQLESIMPEDSTQRPNPPDSFTLNKEKGSNSLVLHDHHNMEGGKMHHELDDNRKSSGSKQLPFSKDSLSYYLNGISPDEYYDEIENSRAKGRFKDDPFYDTADGDDDYLSLGEDKKALLLALEKLNSNNPEHARKKEKIMKQINKHLPNTVSSKN